MADRDEPGGDGVGVGMILSTLTSEDLDALRKSKLPYRPPYMIQDVSRTFFSPARYYIRIKFEGHHYTYFRESDTLIREDVLRWLEDRQKAQKGKAAQEVLR